MKHIIFFMLCTLSLGGLFGQSISPGVYATSGSYFAVSNIQLSWTLGESIIGSDQGFHQSLVSVPVRANPELNFDILVYPNPVASTLSLKSRNPGNLKITIELSDLTGRLLFNKSIGSKNVYQMDFSKYISGIYLLRVTTEEGIFIKTFKILKAN